MRLGNMGAFQGLMEVWPLPPQLMERGGGKKAIPECPLG